MTATWVDFFIMAGVFALIATGALIWVFYFRKGRGKRRHKHHHQLDRFRQLDWHQPAADLFQ